MSAKGVALRKALSRIILGVSALKPHRCRYSKVPVNLDCPFCKGTRESEMHFIGSCPKYSTLRKSFIPTKYYVHPNAFKLSLLLADEKTNKTKNCTWLALFLSKAFHVRNQSLQAYMQGSEWSDGCLWERESERLTERASERAREKVSKLVFYAQSTGTVISGRYISYIFDLINVCVLKWVYIQF